ncbi:MAG: TPM domain-containing protein [Oscillospiraceae bacterium]|nr:TPM domain-containing protein [Oscillospiraceae bacterium]
MKKRLISLLFVLALCVLTVLPVFASSGSFVYDFCDTGIDSAALSDEAQAIYNETGVALYFIITDDLGDLDSEAFVNQFAQEHDFIADRVVLLEGPTSYYICASGTQTQFMTEQDVVAMREAYVDADTYADGVRAYYSAALAVLSQSDRTLTLPTDATESVVIPGGEETSEHSKRLVDDGELLTAKQETAIAQKLDEVSEKHDLDLVVVTVRSLDGKSGEAFADDYYDYNGYRKDGVLLLYCPNEHARHISTTGDAIGIFDDDALDELIDGILPYFNRGDFNGACLSFADICDEIVTSARAFPWGMLVIALLLGAGLAWLIPMSSMKGALKSVRSQAAASDYVRAGSMSLTQNRDVFLYANVTRTAIPKERSSGGGTHVGSSGTSHGGRSF